jgi:hypothetical protein
MDKEWRGPGLGPPLTARRIQYHWQREGQDWQRQGKDSGQGVRVVVKIHTGKTSSLQLVGCISDQFPTRGTPTTSLCLTRKVSASHDKSLPRAKSLRLARQVSASHDKSLPCATSLHLAWEVSTLHEKSPPRTTSPAPTGAWVRRATKAHGTSATTDACGGTITHAMQVPQLPAMQAAHPDKSLNAGRTGSAAILSPSSPTMHSSTLYYAQEPRLRLGRDWIGWYSGRLRQAQTTQRMLMVYFRQPRLLKIHWFRLWFATNQPLGILMM